MSTHRLFCCQCQQEVSAHLITGITAYPHRADLAALPFWQCPVCRCFVGCHHKDAANPLRPLGVIPSPVLTRLRKQIHCLLDPLWQSGAYTRTALYQELGDLLGHPYHTAELRTEAEARKVLIYLQQFDTAQEL